MSVSLGGLASLRHARAVRHAAIARTAGATCARCAIAFAALWFAGALAVDSGRPLLAGLCIGAGLPLAAAAAGAGRRARGAIEALAFATALCVYDFRYGATTPLPAPLALFAIGLLGAVAVAVEAARRATLGARFEQLPFWLLAALLAAAGYLHVLARSWRDLLASGAPLESDTLAYLVLTSAHAGYALFGMALLLGLLMRAFRAAAPAPTRAMAVAERWHLIAAAGVALVTLASAARFPF
jgi:heme/copper-type cytochrome/quinol oxidase subunit 3